MQINIVIMSFTLQLSQTRRRTSAKAHSILYMGRTADQRSWYRAFKEGRVHPDHTELHQVHCWVPNIIPHYPVNSSHIVQPRNDINFVVSFRHIRSSSLCVCEYNTGTVCSINNLTSCISTYQKSFTRPFDTIISHESKFYIWNYSRINQYRSQRQENVALFSFNVSHHEVLYVSSLYETMSINNSTVFLSIGLWITGNNFIHWFFKRTKENFTLSVYIEGEREMPITNLYCIIWVLIWRHITWDLAKLKTVIQDHKLNHSFMSAYYFITHLIL